LAVWGVARAVAYFVTAREMVLGSFALTQGALLMGFGICFLVRPGVLAAFLTIALAVVLLVGGVMKLQYAIELSGLGVRGWWIELLGAALMVILGIVAFVNPFEAGEALMMFLGAAFVVDGVWDLASVICISALARKVRRREEQMAADARAQADALEVEFISRED